MTMIGKPKIDKRPEQPYMGIRTQVTFKGMFKVVDRISKQMANWVKSHEVDTAGPPFLRYHAIDMAGMMDITYGYPVHQTLPDDGPVTAGILPAGRYASLVYAGNGYSGNKTLIEWVRSNGMDFDRWGSEHGDNFRSRYETFLTDPKIEHRKTKWEIEVAIKLADDLSPEIQG